MFSIESKQRGKKAFLFAPICKFGRWGRSVWGHEVVLAFSKATQKGELKQDLKALNSRGEKKAGDSRSTHEELGLLHSFAKTQETLLL